MQYRKLPKGTEEISVIGLGSSAIGEAGEKEIARNRIAREFQRKVGLSRMLRHSFVGEGYRRQRVEFEGGIAVEVDFEQGTYAFLGC